MKLLIGLFKMRLVLVALFVFISSVICLNENNNSEQSDVQGRYNFNRPPSDEDNNPIPVAVVYETEAIAEKSRNLKTEEDSKPDVKIEEENHTAEENRGTVTSERIETTTVVAKSTPHNKQVDIPVRSKARQLSNLQIPVEVVYDSVPDNVQNFRVFKNFQVTATEANIPRKNTQLRRRKQQQNKTENERPIIKNSELSKPETQNVGKPPPRRIESEMPHSQRGSDKQKPVTGEINTKSEHRKRERDPVVPIVESENYVFSHNGNFHYSYEGGDGTKAHSEGHLRSVNDKAAGEAVSGGFSYTDKEGNDFSLSYTADENGYRPIGAHLPTPPPIPPAIARALAYLATATTPEPVTKPSVKQT